VLLVASVERARALLLAAARLAPGAAVGLPANASHDLVEAIKGAGHRLATLAPRQQAVLAELRRGLDEAAGLPV
jgi:hypothetical protein